MSKVTCNRKDECQFKGCTHREKHEGSDNCERGCLQRNGIDGAICLPEPALVRCDSWEDCPDSSCEKNLPHEPVIGCFERFYCRRVECHVRCNPVPEPAAPHGAVCQACGMTNDRVRHSTGTGFLCDDYMACANRVERNLRRSAETELEALRPHGVAFKGTATQLVRYFAGMTEQRFQALMHADFTIREAEDRKAVAERIMRENGQGDREAEAHLKRKVWIEVFNVARDYIGNTVHQRSIEYIADGATARIMKLIGEGE